MTVNLTIHVTYDKDKDGSLGEFRAKYDRFRTHVTRLQASGVLPRGEVRWCVTRDGPTPPDSPAAVQVVRGFTPAIVHRQGTTLGGRIDTERIAM